MRSTRSYRPLLSREKSISEIINSGGKKYDPQVVEALLRLIEKKLIT
jgi:HD-GYP domain-containing protein (c-di-GMP phosphodiesterase class II)